MLPWPWNRKSKYKSRVVNSNTFSVQVWNGKWVKRARYKTKGSLVGTMANRRTCTPSKQGCESILDFCHVGKMTQCNDSIQFSKSWKKLRCFGKGRLHPTQYLKNQTLLTYFESLCCNVQKDPTSLGFQDQFHSVICMVRIGLYNLPGKEWRNRQGSGRMHPLWKSRKSLGCSTARKEHINHHQSKPPFFISNFLVLRGQTIWYLLCS